MRNAECERRNAKGGMRNEEYGMRNVPFSIVPMNLEIINVVIVFGLNVGTAFMLSAVPHNKLYQQ